jgi:hypothetical protein
VVIVLRCVMAPGAKGEAKRWEREYVHVGDRLVAGPSTLQASGDSRLCVVRADVPGRDRDVNRIALAMPALRLGIFLLFTRNSKAGKLRGRVSALGTAARFIHKPWETRKTTTHQLGSLPSTRGERRIGRKRSLPASAMAPSPEVIDLTGDDDDSGGGGGTMAVPRGGGAGVDFFSSRKRRKHLLGADRKKPPPQQQQTLAVASKSSQNVKKEAADGEMKPAASMDFGDVDDDDDDPYFDDEVQLVDPPATLELFPSGAAPVSASSSDGRGSAVVAAAAKWGVASAAATASAAPNGDDVELVGTKNSTRLSHMRQHCTEHPFSVDPKLFCQDCYCYVCDVPASECETWERDHCRATNTGPTAYSWRLRREQAKNPKPPAWNSPCLASDSTDSTDSTATSDPYNRLYGSGPWEPNHPDATANYAAYAGINAYDTHLLLVKCRHCGWFSRNKRSLSSNPSCDDWCYACGRVGDPAALLKRQGKAYKPGPTSIRLGAKTYPFRLRAHDPRKMRDFQARWATFEDKPNGWKYSEVDMEKELFDHRFGKRPSLERILGSVPVVENGKIPVDGARKFVTTATGSTTLSAVETEAVLLDTDAVQLLDALYSIAPRFGANSVSRDGYVGRLEGNLIASWNKETRSGVRHSFRSVFLIDLPTCCSHFGSLTGACGRSVPA